MKTTTIKQRVMLPGSPHDVFELLMDEKKHAEFTGGKAKISRDIRGAFSVFDGWATGVTMNLIADKKIVQTWRGADWPKDTFSKVTFTLSTAKHGSTKLEFLQTDVPAKFANDVAQGWRDYYWEPMKEALAGS